MCHFVRQQQRGRSAARAAQHGQAIWKASEVERRPPSLSTPLTRLCLIGWLTGLRLYAIRSVYADIGAAPADDDDHHYHRDHHDQQQRQGRRQRGGGSNNGNASSLDKHFTHQAFYCVEI